MKVALYERIWLSLAAAMLVAFLAVITIGTLLTGRVVPGMAEAVNPDTVAVSDPRFAQPRVVEVSPGVYEAYVVSRMFSFSPQEIDLPTGADVTFYVTSPDVIHGFQIVGTNLNAMVLPGYVTKLKAKFTRPGEYLIICNEYCGLGHQFMSAKLEVESE